MKNTFGGIFVINEKEISKEEMELLEFRSNLILRAELGNIETQLKDLQKDSNIAKHQLNLRLFGMEQN